MPSEAWILLAMTLAFVVAANVWTYTTLQWLRTARQLTEDILALSRHQRGGDDGGA